MMLRKVVLPEPLSPSTATNSCSRKETVMPSTARVSTSPMRYTFLMFFNSNNVCPPICKFRLFQRESSRSRLLCGTVMRRPQRFIRAIRENACLCPPLHVHVRTARKGRHKLTLRISAGVHTQGVRRSGGRLPLYPSCRGKSLPTNAPCGKRQRRAVRRPNARRRKRRPCRLYILRFLKNFKKHLFPNCNSIASICEYFYRKA